MGGVDLSNCVLRASQRWTHKVFYSILDTVVVNIWLIYKWIAGKPDLTKIEFMKMLIDELIAH